MNFSASRLSALLALLACLGVCLAATLGSALAEDEAARRQQVLAMFAEYKKDAFAAAPDVSPETVLALRQRGEQVLLVDVRDSKEQAVSMLPGAVTEAEFLARVQAEPRMQAGNLVVAYCTVGYRSGVFALRMADQGVSVLNLQGGALNWTHAGGDLVDGEGKPVKRLHVYGKQWDLAAAGIQGVY